MPSPKKSLTELLTDTEEAGDLLQLYGIEAPDKKQTKQRLEQLLAQLGEAKLLESLFELARGFALMAQEIFDLAREAHVGIQGQILLPTRGTPLALAALDSGWAFSNTAPMNTEIDDRAQALIGRLSGIVDALDPEQFIQSATETRETSLGRSLRLSPDPKARVFRRVLRSSAERTYEYQTFSDADKRAVTSALDAVHQARSHLSSVHLPAGLKATFEELETRCQAILDAMAQATEQDGEANPIASALSDEIQLVSIRLRELAEETGEAVRAEGGFRDFLKSDFWFQRWRIYELWVLCRVLRTLQRLGGKITIERVINGVWHLKYGRDYEPIATCEIGGRHLDLYYQLYRKDHDATRIPDEKTADMPDIAVFERIHERKADVSLIRRLPGVRRFVGAFNSESPSLGRAVAVIDPKHGLSFKYKKVDEVLTRYADKFQADLTAVVNYYPMRSYPFNLNIFREKRLVLASDVAPGSVSGRRLELCLEDTLLSGKLASLKPIAEPPKVKSERRRAEAGLLIYIAREDIEVDEPAGLWVLSERGGVVPVPEAHRFTSEEIEAIDAAPDGTVCVLQTSKQLVWLIAQHKPRVFDKPNDLWASVGWNPAGTHFAAVSSDRLYVWTRDVSEPALIRFAYNQYDSDVAWESTGDAVILQVRPDFSSPHRLIRLDLSGHETLLYEGADRSTSHLNFSTIPLGEGKGTLVNSRLGTIHVTPTGTQQWRESDMPLSISPSGTYRIFDGPRSKRWEEDVQLLRLEISNAQTKQLPFIRFRGGIGNSIRWSLDESRFAFLAERKDAAGYSTKTLMYGRPGDRYAEAVSLPRQDPQIFTWVTRSLLNSL